MNEEYIKGLYTNLGGEGKFGSYDDFVSVISTDEAYTKGFYDNLGGESKFGKYEDFYSLVSNKQPQDLGKQETVQESADATVVDETEADTESQLESGLSELFVTPKEVGLDEEELSKLLNERFKGTQFEVDETFPFVDGIKITNKNKTGIDGKPDSETFFIDAFTDDGDVEYASKINEWIKGSKEAEESESNLVGGISMDQPVFEPETIARARLKYAEQAEKGISFAKELQKGEDDYFNAVENATLEDYNTVYNESVSKLNNMSSDNFNTYEVYSKEKQKTENIKNEALILKNYKSGDFNVNKLDETLEAFNKLELYNPNKAKKIRPLYLELESQAVQQIDKIIDTLNIEDYTEETLDLIKDIVADDKKISDEAIKQFGEGSGDNVKARQIFKTRLRARASNYDQTREVKETAASSPELKKFQEEVGVDAVEHLLGVSPEAQKARENYDFNMSLSSQNLSSKQDSLNRVLKNEYKLNRDSIQAKFNLGEFRSKESANYELKKLNDKTFNRIQKEEQDLISIYNINQNKLLSEYNEVISSESEKYEYNLTPEQELKLNGILNKIYSDVFKSKNQKRAESRELMESIVGPHTGPIIGMVKDFNHMFFDMVSNMGTSLDMPAVTELGNEFKSLWSPEYSPIEDYEDLLDPTKVAKSVGRLMGSAAPGLIAATAAGATTGGLGVTPTLAVVATTGWISESASIAGNVERRILEETGSPLKASEGANAAWSGQIKNIWTYALDGIPFIGRTSRLGGPLGRVLLSGGIESVTETVQETFQTAQEEQIMASVRSGGKITEEGFFEKITPKLIKSTALEVAPGSFFMSGGSRFLTEISLKDKQSKIVSGLTAEINNLIKLNREIGKIDFEGKLKSQLIKQKIFSSVLQYGKNFTNTWLNSLLNAQYIDSDKFSNLSRQVDLAQERIDSRKLIGNMSNEQFMIYNNLLNKANEAFDNIEESSKESLGKGVLSDLRKEAEDLQSKADEFLKNPSTAGDYVLINTDGKFLILEEEKATELFNNNPVLLTKSVPGVKISFSNSLTEKFEAMRDEMKSRKVEAPAPFVPGQTQEEASVEVNKAIEDMSSDGGDYVKSLISRGVMSTAESRMDKSEPINESEIDSYINSALDEIDKVEALDISREDKDRIIDELYELANKLDNYEFVTETKTKKTTKTRPTRRVIKDEREGKKTPKERIIGRKVEDQSQEETIEVESTQDVTTPKIEELRKKEQAEMLAEIPNAEQAITDGKVDRSKIKSQSGKAKFDKILNKYDKIISPLIKAEREKQGGKRKAKQGVGDTVVMERADDGTLSLQSFDKDGNKTTRRVLDAKSIEDFELVETIKDENNNVVGAVLRNKNNSSEVFSINDQDVALDLAIEKTKAEMGVIDNVVFEETIEEYEQLKEKKAEPVSQETETQATPEAEPEVEEVNNEERDAIMSLKDDEVILQTTKTLDEIPEEFRSRAEKVRGKFSTRKTILGIPYGKEEIREVDGGFRYTLTGKEAKEAFQKRTAPAEEEQTSRTKQQISALEEQVEKAKVAISTIAPKTKIIIAKDEAEYNRLTEKKPGASTSRAKYHKGNIYINPNKFVKTSVPHEIFHVALLTDGMSNEEAQAITDRMIKAVKRNYEKGGVTAEEQEMLDEIEKFGKKYEDSLQSEESIAELVGILASNYSLIEKRNKGLIKRWLDKLAKLFGLKPFTDEEVLDLLNVLSQKIQTGEAITQSDIKIIRPKRKKQESIKEQNERFQNDFFDKVSGFHYMYDKNSAAFKKIEEDYITRDRSIADFNEVFMVLHQPDAAFSGQIKKGKTILVEGKGGVYYPIKFHDKGYFWASTSKAAKDMAKFMNDVMDKNGGKIFMALTSAPIDKVLSSTNGANGVLDMFVNLSKNKVFNVDDIKSIIFESYRKTLDFEIVEVDDKKVKRLKEVSDLNESQSLGSIIKEVKKKLRPDESIFGDRKKFSESILKGFLLSMGTNKENQDGHNKLGSILNIASDSKSFIVKQKAGFNVSATSLQRAVGQVLAEPILRNEQRESKSGLIYAVLEINGKVEPVEARGKDDHQSYPFAIKSTVKNKMKLHLLTDRVDWRTVTIDPDTNDFVSKSGKVLSTDPEKAKKGIKVERWTQIMGPSLGVTTSPIQINSSNVTTTPQSREQRIEEASEKLTKLFDRDNVPLTISEAKEMVREVYDWTSWYDGLSSYVNELFSEYGEDVLSMLPLASMAANSSATVGMAINNAERIYKGEKPKGVAEYYGYVTDFLEGRGIKSDKMYNFFKALSGDKNAVAVDMHVYSIIMGRDPNKKQANPSNKKQFEKAKEFVNLLADEMNLAPREIQAALWALNILRTGGKPDSYEKYFEKQVEKRNLKQTIQGWRKKGYKPFSEVRKAKEQELSTQSREQKSTDEVYEMIDMTPVEVQEWKDNNKKGITMPYPKEVLDATKKYVKGEITLEERTKVLDKFFPSTLYNSVPTPATIREIVLALDKSKVEKGIIGLTSGIDDGTRVASRLDIPAYLSFGIYIDTIHGPKKNEVLGYGQTAVLTDVVFKSNVTLALKVASTVDLKQRPSDKSKRVAGEQYKTNKSPFAVMEGSYLNESTESAFSRAKKALKSEEWIQVGFNPYRHAYFYDRKTDNRLVSADEVIQVGPLVLAKGAVTAKGPLEKVNKSTGEVVERFQIVDDETSNAYANIDSKSSFQKAKKAPLSREQKVEIKKINDLLNPKNWRNPKTDSGVPRKRKLPQSTIEELKEMRFLYSVDVLKTYSDKDLGELNAMITEIMDKGKSEISFNEKVRKRKIRDSRNHLTTIIANKNNLNVRFSGRDEAINALKDGNLVKVMGQIYSSSKMFEDIFVEGEIVDGTIIFIPNQQYKSGGRRKRVLNILSKSFFDLESFMTVIADTEESQSWIMDNVVMPASDKQYYVDSDTNILNKKRVELLKKSFPKPKGVKGKVKNFLKDKLQEKTGIILVNKSTNKKTPQLSISNVVYLYNAFKMSDTAVKFIDSGFSMKDMNFIVDYVNKNPEVKAYADGMVEIYKEYLPKVNEALNLQGYEELGSTRSKTKEELSKMNREGRRDNFGEDYTKILDKIYGVGNVPLIENYSPTSALSSETNKMQNLSVFDEKFSASAFAKNAIEKTTGGTLNIRNNEVVFENYVDGMTNMVGAIKILESYSGLFSVGNMRLLEQEYGSEFKTQLENTLNDIIYGRPQSTTSSESGNPKLSKWVNLGNASIMFFNVTSAVTQMLSVSNYMLEGNIDSSDYMANVSRFRSDEMKSAFKELISDPAFRQRLEKNLNSIEMQAIRRSEFSDKGSNVDWFYNNIDWLLQKGYFLTTKFDSFAIAIGGTAFYKTKKDELVRKEIESFLTEKNKDSLSKEDLKNMIDSSIILYNSSGKLPKGLSISEAKEKAMKLTYFASNKSQQASSMNRVSGDQKNAGARTLLGFKTTSMQYNRIIFEKSSDIKNGRGDIRKNLAAIAYYGFLQGMLFNGVKALLSALGDDEEEDLKLISKTTLNRTIDGFLVGFGVYGVGVVVLKQLIYDITEYLGRGGQFDKETMKLLEDTIDMDFSKTNFRTELGILFDALGTASPSLGVKARKIYGGMSAMNDGKYFQGLAKIGEGATSVPLSRLWDITDAFDSRLDYFDRILRLTNIMKDYEAENKIEKKEMDEKMRIWKKKMGIN